VGQYQLRSCFVYEFADGIRVACDLMVLFFIYDEFSDKVDGDGARIYAEMVMDTIKNPHKERPQGEEKLGEITRQYVYCASHESISYLIDHDKILAACHQGFKPGSSGTFHQNVRRVCVRSDR
jgi:hypothetical protein